MKRMKTEKMSFKNIKDVLSWHEMKGIMAGSGGSTHNSCAGNGGSVACGSTVDKSGAAVCTCPTYNPSWNNC
jgi:hypothetical protein